MSVLRFLLTQGLPQLTGWAFSLGGGTNLVADGDPEGFLHLIDAALK